MIDKLIGQLFVRTGDRRSVYQALATLERSEVCQPTHWSRTKSLRDPYSRVEIDEYIDESTAGSAQGLLYIKRVAPPRYICAISMSSSDQESGGASWLCIDSDLQLQREDVWQLARLTSELASSLDVEFGLLEVSFSVASGGSASSGSREHHALFLERGPSTLHARTFFGPELMRRLGGIDALARCGLHAVMLSDTVCQADLLAEPWQHGSNQLDDARRRACDCLRASGVFGS